MAHVIVLGGGFGGLAAAHTLRQVLPEGDRVTVVASRREFYIGFAKLWDLVGARPLAEGRAPLEHLEHYGISFRNVDVTAIDPRRRAVTTTEETLEADGLVVALGSGYADAHLQLLANAGGHNLWDASALPDIRTDLRHFRGRLVVAILGVPHQCPPAPYEAMLLLDDWFREEGRRGDVELAISTPQAMTLGVAGPDASAYLADLLLERGVELLTERTITGAQGRALHCVDGVTVPFDLLLGVPAAAPLPLLSDSPLAGPSGWIEPDADTFATAFERIYAVGDCTRVPTAAGELPKAGVFAEGAGRVAARNLAADLHGGDRTAFDGRGHCFLELPGRRVAMIGGDFYARPKPDVSLSEPDEGTYDIKVRWEQERLREWLG